MDRLSLLLRALWWRRGLSAATLLVALITIGAGSLGPLYARAADESTLRDRLLASPTQAALHYSFGQDLQTEGDLNEAIALGPRPGSIKAYPRVVAAVVLPTRTQTPQQVGNGDLGPTTRMVWRDGSCAHLTIVRGRCVTAANEVVVSERTLDGDYYGWQVGMRIQLPGVQQDVPGGAAKPAVVTIVGSYRLRDSEDPFWQGRTYFDAHPGYGDAPDAVDALFIDRSELATLATPTHVEVQVDYPIDPHQVRLSGVARLRKDVAQLSVFRAEASPDSSFNTDVLQVLNAAAAEQRLVDRSTLLVSLQLAVLAWLVLFQVIADAVEAKGSEIALAKLRGLPPLATLNFGLVEPLLLIAVATPLGLLGGWLSVRLFATSALVPGTPVALTAATVVAVAAALAGSMVAAVAAGRRTLRRSVLEQWRRTPGHHPSRWMLALDVLLALAAIAGLVALRRAGSHGGAHPATLLAPALLVFAVALLGIRLVPIALRPLLPLTRGTRRIGLFLAARQVVRRPAGLRLAALLAVAVGLATFAIAGEGVAQSNRQARARAEIGAPGTAPVQFEPLHDPIEATRVADPDGRWAMATANWLPDGGSSVTGRLLAVDASRLVAVAYPASGGLSTAQLATAIHPVSTPKPLLITGSAVRVTLSASNLTPGTTPIVVLNLRAPNRPPLNIRAGSLRPGSHSYQVTANCRSGCTLTGFTWERPIDTFGPLGGTVLVSGIEVQQGGQWQPLSAGLASIGDWRRAKLAGNATDQLTATGAGLSDAFTSRDGGSAGIAHNDSPSPLPVVAGAFGVVTGPDAPSALQVADNTDTRAIIDVVATSRVLPSVLTDGVLVDLSAIRAQLPTFDSEANWSIWLGPAAPPDALARLQAAGLVLQAGPTETGRLDELARQGPALALRLLVVCAIAGSVLAVGGTAIAIAATGRRRSFELASLRALGIGRRTLLRSSVIEQLLLLGAAVLLGGPAGYLAARLAMPTIPEFADPTPVALHYRPALLGVLLFALAFLALLVVTAILAGRALMRAAAPSRLREAE
ncbi:MAG TPA: FtsX-like permease family protein [Jatrophihabitans sp.]|nr:FtsX-like permease family protein [Jatrophihabitans sp.]